MIEEGLLGKKSGGGFYVHPGGKRTANAAAVKLVERYAQGSGSTRLSDEDILDRLMLTMVNESAMCLQEGVVDRADYLDMALIAGIGFPPFRGGLLCYADSRGISEIVGRLTELKEAYGARFEPAGRLQDMLAAGTTFLGRSNKGESRDE